VDKTQDYFDAWHKGQKNLFDGFMENTQKAQELLLGQKTPAFSSGAGGFNDLYSSWTAAVQNSLSQTGNDNMQNMRENLSKMLGGSNAYLKVYDIWLPLLKAAQEKSFNFESYKDYVDPAKYKDLIDKVFGFDPDSIKLMLDQAVLLLELSSGTSQQFTKPWTDAAKSSMGVLPQFAQGHPESLIQMFHSMFNAFDSTIGRAFHVPPVGKDREKVELVMRTIDDIAVYAAKNVEYQNVIYLTGMAAMEKVIERLAEKLKSGEEIKKFDEFFDIWIDVSEKSYFDLFQTEEFSRLQGEFLDAGLNARTRFFKVMEMYLYDFPIVLRTEMDDHYKTVYELKKRVKKLENQVKEAAL
jgi:class III poly(R)-hydroxyalkanoic acid synthase PhaE subunit